IDTSATPTFGSVALSSTTPQLTITTSSGTNRASVWLNGNVTSSFAIQQDNTGAAIIENYMSTAPINIYPHNGVVAINPSTALATTTLTVSCATGTAGFTRNSGGTTISDSAAGISLSAPGGTVAINPGGGVTASQLTVASTYGTATLKRDNLDTSISDTSGASLHVGSTVYTTNNVLDDGKGKMTPVIMLGLYCSYLNASSSTSVLSNGWTQLRNNGTYKISQGSPIWSSTADTWTLPANGTYKILISYRIGDQAAASGDSTGVRMYDTVNNVDLLEYFAAIDAYGRRCDNWMNVWSTGASALTFRVDAYQNSGVSITAQYFNVCVERVG
ncbi:MAG: hypothetical protein KGL39_43845, partial [Patescibacteria group bacterium]|nr:hypothetical protein [Patescibacteria group bacterium]